MGRYMSGNELVLMKKVFEGVRHEREDENKLPAWPIERRKKRYNMGVCCEGE